MSHFVVVVQHINLLSTCLFLLLLLLNTLIRFQTAWFFVVVVCFDPDDQSLSVNSTDELGSRREMCDLMVDNIGIF